MKRGWKGTYFHLSSKVNYIDINLPCVTDTSSCWAAHQQACETCTCPATRLNKELGGSKKDIYGLRDGGPYKSEARSWNDTPADIAESKQDAAANFVRGRLPFIRGIDCRLARWLVTRETSRGARPSLPRWQAIMGAEMFWSTEQ